MSVELSVLLQLAGCRVKVVLLQDFYHNCMTKNPFSHSHPKFELHYFLRGSAALCTSQTPIRCEKGQFLLVPGHCVHRILPLEPDTQTLSLLFSLEMEVGAAFMPLRCTAPLIICDTFGGEQRLLQIRQELTDRRPAFTEKIQGELTALLADLARATGKSHTDVKKTQEENRAEQIEAYFNSHGLEPECSCEHLAQKLGLSTRQVHRVCMQSFGQPFRKLLTGMRMEVAAYRLHTTDISIAALAEELGYSSAASFSAAYRRFFGTAPSRNRKRF